MKYWLVNRTTKHLLNVCKCWCVCDICCRYKQFVPKQTAAMYLSGLRQVTEFGRWKSYWMRLDVSGDRWLWLLSLEICSSRVRTVLRKYRPDFCSVCRVTRLYFVSNLTEKQIEKCWRIFSSVCLGSYVFFSSVIVLK